MVYSVLNPLYFGGKMSEAKPGKKVSTSVSKGGVPRDYVGQVVETRGSGVISAVFGVGKRLIEIVLRPSEYNDIPDEHQGN